jgi:hypothetical protein
LEEVRVEAAAGGFFIVFGCPQVLLVHVLAGVLHGVMELEAVYVERILFMLLVGEVLGGRPPSASSSRS